MSNHGQSTVLNLQRFVPGGTGEAPNGQEGSLTALIQRGAKAVADAGAPITVPAGTGLPPVQLLGALSYCYVKGVYESAEIENRMWRNAALRAATHDNIPGSSLIRRFRRLNCEAIRATLEEAFRFLRRKAKEAARAPLPGQPPANGHSGSFDPETTVTFVRKEAERTLNDAAFVDNMSAE
jgi:hypothetical protein